MKELLKVSGVVSIVICVIAGIFTHSFLGFLIYAFGGALTSLIPFGLAEVLENQEVIIHNLHSSSSQTGGILHLKGKKVCEACNKEVEEDRTSCPYCGGRDFK